MKTLLFAATLFLAGPALAQSPKVAALEWMTGTWVARTHTSTVTESWVGPDNGMMVAVNLSTWKSGRKFYEFLRIGETPEGFSYFASPGGKPAVEFKVKELAERKVVFENPQHDFPQRILYWRDGEALVARVEGIAKGQPRHEEWRFERAR